MKLLVLSNGAGEDAIAASVLNHLLALRPELELEVFPLVGAGSAYAGHWKRLGDLSAPPSGGLSNQSWRLWWRDLRHGLLGRVLEQWNVLRGRRGATVLAVGDLLPCALAALAGLGPIYFIGTAKSIYHHAYSWPERFLLKRWVKRSLVRDQPTADFLTRHGLPAAYLGNAMMDATVPSGRDLGLGSLPVLALFPGSRQQAPLELPRQLRIWQRLCLQFPCQAAVAVAPGMPLDSLRPEGWRLLRGEPVAWLENSEGLRVALVSNALGDLLHIACLGLGQAGTAHEQAAGAGVPVVALHPDPQGPLGWYRGRQKGLLGEALLVVSEDEEVAARALLRLALDADERARRGAVGRQRMGAPGGAARMAAWLARQL